MPIYLRILLLIAGLYFAAFIATAALGAVPVPFLDILGIIAGYLADGLSWQWLLQPWNTHVIAIPRLLLAADIALTGGHMLIFVVLGLLAWCTVFPIVWSHIERVVRDRSLRLLAGTVLAFMLFRAFLLESIIFNNGFNYPLAAIFAVSAFAIAAMLSTRQPVLAKSSFAALFALASSLCLANGVLALPIAAGVAGLRSRSWRATLPFAVVFPIMAWLYLREAVSGASSLQIDPGIMLQALINMFGAPWVLKTGMIGQAYGLLVILIALATGLFTLRRMPRLNATDCFALALLMFGMGSAMLVAAGRPELSGNMGAIGRYVLWPILVHVGLLLILIQNSSIMKLPDRPAIRALLLAGAALMVFEQARVAPKYIAVGRDMQAAGTALQAGARDPAVLARIRSEPDGPVFDLYAARGLYGFR